MDLTTRYLGLTLKSPLIAGAGPLTAELDNIRHLEDLGTGAIVLPSIFEEQIEQEQRLIENMHAIGADNYSEALTYFPVSPSHQLGPRHYLELLRKTVEAVDIPVIASLNGTTDHGWVRYAREIEEAGADALELNIYFIPTELDISAQEVERRYITVLRAVKETVAIPVAVKLAPYFSATGQMAAQLANAGANGLVLFNRFYQPDIDLAKLELLTNLELSTPAEIRLPLLWIGILSRRLSISLAASTGVDNADEVLKYLLVGADVVMTTSALLRYGLNHMGVLLAGLNHWLAARDLDSLDSVRGRLSQRAIEDPTAFVRSNYIRILQSFEVNK